MTRREHALKGLASLAGAACNLVQASELLDDLLAGGRHFRGPRWWRAALFVAACWLAAEEAAKVRRRLKEATA